MGCCEAISIPSLPKMLYQIVISEDGHPATQAAVCPPPLLSIPSLLVGSRCWRYCGVDVGTTSRSPSLSLRCRLWQGAISRDGCHATQAAICPFPLSLFHPFPFSVHHVCNAGVDGTAEWPWERPAKFTSCACLRDGRGGELLRLVRDARR